MPPCARSVELASLVQPCEAAAFTRLCASAGALYQQQLAAAGDACDAIAAEARAVFGEGTSTCVQGSTVKRTAVVGSDIDLLIDTPAPATLAQRQALEARLKAHPAFNAAHVSLKRLAIHVCVGSVDIDVLCAHTVEYGERPRADARVTEDAAVQQAAQALKMWAAQGEARKVPGHQMENLALHCRGALPCAAPPVGDGAMQLFVHVLQSIVDAPDAVLRGATQLDGRTRALLSQLARAALHVFALSRAVPGAAFRCVAEVAAWVRNAKDAERDTPAGRAPAWLFQSARAQRASLITLFSELAAVDDDADADEEVQESPYQLTLLLQSPLGAYTLAGASSSSHGGGIHASSAVRAELDALERHAADGCAVAERMLLARQLWCEGEAAMRGSGGGGGSGGNSSSGSAAAGDAAHAVACFAAALRASVADGDPFSGWFVAQSAAGALAPQYASACDAVLSAEPAHADALLLRAMVLTRGNRTPEAEAALDACVAAAPDDAHGALFRRHTLLGNLGRWRDSLADVERALALAPQEAVFHYWRAVTRRNLPEFNSSAAGMAATVSDYRRFLALASPEGRKVCEALYQVAVTELMQAGAPPSAAAVARFVRDARAAQAAEAAKLPVFAATTCDAKRMAETLLLQLDRPLRAAGAAQGSQPLASGDDAPAGVLRKLGNDAFAAQEYETADEAYTRALQQAPQQAELLANRAAARIALRWFTAAAADAAAAAAARPDWAKAHYRAAQAHLGRKDGAAALAAASRAAELLPGDAGVARVKADAEKLAAKRPPPPVAPAAARANAALWARVMFKDAVHIVSASGGAAFACVSDALQQLLPRQQAGGGITLVLLPGVYEEHIALMSDAPLQLQLLGWNEATTEGVGTQSELRCCDARKRDHTLVTAAGSGVRLHLARLVLAQPVGAPQVASGACVACVAGAHVSVTACVARTPASPCFTCSGAATRLSLTDVAVKKSGAAAVVEDGELAASGCSFTGCLRTAVEVRRGGTARLRSCAFSKCAAQAASLWAEGVRLEMDVCTLRECGKLPALSALLVECGTAALRGCTLADNPGDAIVLQGNTAPDGAMRTPVLQLDACTLARNGGAGVCVYYGSGVLAGSSFVSNATAGCVTNGVSAGQTLRLRGNTLSANGPRGAPCDVQVAGHTLMQRAVQIDADNALSTPPCVLPDNQAARMREQLERDLGRQGVRPSGQFPAPAAGVAAPQQRPGWQMSREAAIARHMAKIAALAQLGEDPVLFAHDNSSAETRKAPSSAASSATHAARSRLAAVPVAALRVGETHAGRVLRGRLLVPPLLLTSVFTLLEDDAGDVVKLSLYNAVPPSGSGARRAAAAQRVLPRGAVVEVVEPFFKQFADGTYGVRIDDPRQLSILD
jgi:hypothetical protein